MHTAAWSGNTGTELPGMVIPLVSGLLISSHVPLGDNYFIPFHFRQFHCSCDITVWCLVLSGAFNSVDVIARTLNRPADQ